MTEVTVSPAASTVLEHAEELLQRRAVAEAEDAFRAAAAAGADLDRCSAGLWQTSMLQGVFEAAWRQSDAIRRRGAADPHRFWNGEDVRGRRVIVRCLHGLGDAVQMLRLLPRLSEITHSVILEVPPLMVELAQLFCGADEVITWGERAPRVMPAWEVQIEIMELPYLLRLGESQLPVAASYLRLRPEEIAGAAEQMGPRRRPRVGLVWAAGIWNPERGMPAACLEPLLRSGVAEFWSLQGGEASSAALPWVRSGRMRDAAECGGGLRVLAAVMAQMDLVISVDTLAVHLAGAMGKPAWVLLQHAADWRWMTERSDSPWYPVARLFRRGVGDGWESLVERVLEELRDYLREAEVNRA